MLYNMVGASYGRRITGGGSASEEIDADIMPDNISKSTNTSAILRELAGKVESASLAELA